MLAFIFLPIGMLGLHESLKEGKVERRSYRTLVLSIIAVGLSLPFFGIELFALHDISQTATAGTAAGLVDLQQSIRMGLGLYVFLLGLILVAVTGIMWIAVVWSSGILPKWSGFPLGMGLALIIPQFFTPPPVRIAHGLLLGAGCIWISWGILKQSKT
jgi:hypothetical protein